MTEEFKSFYKTVEGGEGDRCNYPTRLDTYGKGCGNDCDYCYAKSLLGFRKMWNPDNPAVADINKIRQTIRKELKRGDIVRLGGMTDCFQAIEKTHKVTYETIKALNNKGVGYLIVTKNPLIATDEYMDILNKELAHIQISVTTTDDRMNQRYEKAEPYTERKKAIEKLYKAGYDVQVRLSPYIPEMVDEDEIKAIECDKVLIEFLRAGGFVKRFFGIPYQKYTEKHGGYRHLPIEEKVRWANRIKDGFDQASICDDVPAHYRYFEKNFNYNPDDCCNLRRNECK